MKTLRRYLRLAKSKTLVFFGIAGPLLIENADMVVSTVRSELPALQEFLPENPYKTLSCVLVVAGIVLRIYTNSSLKEKTQ